MSFKNPDKLKKKKKKVKNQQPKNTKDKKPNA